MAFVATPGTVARRLQASNYGASTRLLRNRTHGPQLQPVRRTHMRIATEQDHAIPSFVPADAASDIEDETAIALIRSMKAKPVQTALRSEPILTTYIETGNGDVNDPVFVFLHAFDSSLLEFRRIWPLFAKEQAKFYAVDVLGWGFTEKPLDATFGVEGKREHLSAWIHSMVGDKPVIFVGASVGGAVAIDFALAYQDRVAGLALIGAQAFTNKEEDALMKIFPPLAKLGASVLRAKWLRRMACRMSYVSEVMRGEDSMRVGRIHTLTPGWEEATIQFITGRGYCLADRVPEVRCPALVLYGTEDQILPSAENSKRFERELQGGCTCVPVALAGHSPHIEQPRVTADAIMEWSREGLGGE